MNKKTNKTTETPNDTMNTQTPMMQQYLEIKKKHPHELLFFRMGDFYEMFLDDAIEAAKILNITLTRRQDKIPMCGVPHHSVHGYIKRALSHKKNIAICEQVEDPATVTGRIVRRDVVRIITPGTLYEERLLPDALSKLLAVMFVHDKNNKASVLLCDISTAALTYSEVELEKLHSFLEIWRVAEIIVPLESDFSLPNDLSMVYRDYHIHHKAQNQKHLQKFFDIANLSVIENINLCQEHILQLGGYLEEIAPRLRVRWQKIALENQKDFMQIDDSALKSLEVIYAQDNSRTHSLFGVLNRCQLPQGRRLLEQTLSKPLMAVDSINQRLDTVEFLSKNSAVFDFLSNTLKLCADLERIITQLCVNPQVKHISAIRETLNATAQIRNYCSTLKNLPGVLADLNQIDFSETLMTELNNALVEVPPALVDERRLFAVGYSQPLDEFLRLSESAQEVLQQLEENLKIKTNISTLKIRYNKILGYFIEISRGQSDKAPADFIRRQTLVNGERFGCVELSELEEKILGAKEQVSSLQKTLFQDLVLQLQEQSETLRVWSKQLALLDILLCFTQISQEKNYCRPQFRQQNEIILKKSRHAVVEALFEKELFIANDVYLNNSDKHLAILTGPNMAGKSTYIRQIGLIQILAQCGCFVPANSALLPIVDKLFTRIGAYDRLHKGESTFFVEMSECAKIMHQYTAQSLVLLDEVGRGTSTFDGISICKAMIDHFNKAKPKQRAMILFATHYSELSEMIDDKRGIFGLTVSVVEENGKITFLRRIVEGVADKSYGIHVAELAGMPKDLVQQAQHYLAELEATGLIQVVKVAQKADQERKKEKSLEEKPVSGKVTPAKAEPKENHFSSDNQFNLFT